MIFDVPNVLNQSHADDPRLLLSEPFRAVHFVFGLFYPDGQPLPGRAVLGSLAALGFGEEASRGILLRLRRGGFLVSRRSGRTADYMLSPRSMLLVGEISRRATLAPPPWSGAFTVLIVGIPPGERAFREQLRRHASYAGLGSPMSGLLLAADPEAVTPVERLLAGAPPGVTVARGTLSVELAEARRLAGDAWRLRPIADRLRAETAHMEAATRQASATPPEGAAALAFLWRSIGPYFEMLSEGRSLPAELLPDDWPLAQANAAFLELANVVADPARGYVDALAAGRVQG
jgi:phenylacetic acid degradation operon negative regulatory protein